jgi:cytochrome c
MDELGFNKIAAAVLATGLGIMLLREVPHFLMHAEAPEVPVYFVGEAPKPGDEGEEVELPFPQAEWVAAMDAEKGARVFKKCQSCHKVEEGAPNGTGPGLWNVVGNQAGTHEGFSYSAAMAGAGYTWTYEQLDGFLEKPSAHLKGTKMAFVGLRKPEDRAAVIEYMRINDSNPESRPVPAVVEVMEEAVEVIEGSDIEATDAAETVTTILEDAVETVTDAVEETTER